MAHSGLSEIFAGNEAAKYFGVPVSDPRHPDVWGVVQVGVVYTGGTKIAEHGGANPADRDVPIVVYAPGAVQPCVGARMRAPLDDAHVRRRRLAHAPTGNTSLQRVDLRRSCLPPP